MLFAKIDLQCSCLLPPFPLHLQKNPSSQKKTPSRILVWVLLAVARTSTPLSNARERGKSPEGFGSLVCLLFVDRHFAKSENQRQAALKKMESTPICSSRNIHVFFSTSSQELGLTFQPLTSKLAQGNETWNDPEINHPTGGVP